MKRKEVNAEHAEKDAESRREKRKEEKINGLGAPAGRRHFSKQPPLRTRLVKIPAGRRRSQVPFFVSFVVRSSFLP